MNDQTDNGRKPRLTLDSNTLMPLSMVVLVFAGLAWLQTELNSIDGRLVRIESHVGSSLSRKDMMIWSLQLERDNPDLRVPQLEGVLQMDRRYSVGSQP